MCWHYSSWVVKLTNVTGCWYFIKVFQSKQNCAQMVVGLVELVDSQRFAKILFHKVYFSEICMSQKLGDGDTLSKYFYCKNILLHRYVSQELVEWLNWPTHWKTFIMESNYRKNVWRKSWLKLFNWYSLENYFSSFHFLESFVVKTGWIGWFGKIH